MFDPPSVVIFVDLFIKSSFNKSAFALIIASLAKADPPELTLLST